jgi:hypothetical protein
MKDFQRSQGLQGALDRIQKRRSSDPLYQGEKGADPKEVEQMIDLFSKYEGILEHLVHKNQKLKSFVDGETKVYPSEFSYTTVDILETLEKLKLKRAQSFSNAEVTDTSKAGASDKRDIRSRSAGPRMRTDDETTLQKNSQENRSVSALRSRSLYSPKAHEADTPKRSRPSLEKIISTQPCPRRSVSPKRLELRQNEEGDMELEVPRTPSKLNASGRGPDCYSVSSDRSREDPPTNKPHSNGESSRRFPTRDPPSPSNDGRYGKSLESSSRPYSERLPRDRDLRKSDKIICCSSKKTSTELVSIVSGAKAKESQTIADSPVSPESRNETLSPPSIKRETRIPTPLGELRTSPRRLDLIERRRQEAATSFSYNDLEVEELDTLNGKQSGSPHHSCYTLDGSDGQSTVTSPRTPPKHFLPVSGTKQEHNVVPTISGYPYSTNGLGVGSGSSIAPSERARRLQSEISDVYHYSQKLAASQDRLRGDLQEIKHAYRERHGYMADRVSQAMPLPHDGLYYERDHDPRQISVPQLSYESYTYTEYGDGVIHVEEEEIIHLESGGSSLESRPSYHIEDGVIVVEDDDEVEIENRLISNTDDDDDDEMRLIENHSISYDEDNEESFPDILAAIPDSAQNGPGIDYSYSADAEKTDFNSDDSMEGDMPTETDNENSLRGKRETIVNIVSREQLGKEVLRRSTGSLLHSSSSISTKGSARLNKKKAELEFNVPAAKGAVAPRNKKVKSAKSVHSSSSIGTKGSARLNKKKAELEFVVPAAKGALAPRKKKVKSAKSAKWAKVVSWSDHCGALPCGLASF